MRQFIFRRFEYYVSIAALIGLTWLSLGPARPDNHSEVALAAADPVIAAAGDIACDPSSASFNGGNGISGSCRQKSTSDLLVNQGLAAVLPLGDNQYACGGYQAFLQSYHLSWGRVKSITHPVVGNHEYLTSGGTGCTSANAGAAGHFKYFGSAAGSPSQGYYSYNVGAWHLIALNSNCSQVGGCSATSSQGKWLAADLAAHSNYCTLAYWHHPLFSSGGRASSSTRPLWQILYNYNADVVLTGHDHIYERFAPQTASGTLDTARGIREFVVGTGGANHTSITVIAANSEVRNPNTYGVLKLTLHPTSYDWQFVPEAGKTFTDSGTGKCHGQTSAATPTRTPTGASVPTSNPVGSALTFAPAADAHIYQSTPDTNYGSATTLQVDSSPVENFLLKFSVSGTSGQTITRARLRLYATNASGVGGNFYRASSTWQEGTVTWNNAPAAGTTLVASLGSVTASNWYEVDLTSVIAGDGTYSFRVSSTSADGADYSSRQGSNPPQLIIETASALQAGALAPMEIATQMPTAAGEPSVTQTSTEIPTVTATDGAPLLPTDTPTPTDSNVSAAAQTPTSTSAATQTGTTSTYPPIADSYVNAGSPTGSYGSSTTLRADGSPDIRSYLLFDVQGLSGTVTKATLRVYAGSASSLGCTAYSVDDVTWSEAALNYNNAPPLGSPLGSSGAFGAGAWFDLDVTAYITGNGIYSLALTTPGSTAISFASRESGANAPQLIIETVP